MTRTCNEGARGCGYRQPGGLYLMSDGLGQGCDLLPVAAETCPCCGGGIKPARGWTWVDPDKLLPHHGEPVHMLSEDDDVMCTGTRSKTHRGCPLNKPGLMGDRAGLLWIGEQHYATPKLWLAEGKAMGFSRRIPAVPQGFVANETWVLAGHRKAIPSGKIVANGPDDLCGTVYDNLDAAQAAGATSWADHYTPGIFHLWVPTRIEYVVRGDETEDYLQGLADRGIEAVRVVPDVDQLQATA